MTDKKQMWMDFLNTNAEDDVTLERLVTGSPIMQKAVAVLRQMSSDEKELYEIEQREKAVRDEISARAYERQQGIQQGIKQGLQQGVQKGIQQGIQQERNALITRLKQKGYTDSQIAEILSD